MAEVIKRENFGNSVLSNNKLVMVDFFATWCMPCKMLSPSLDELSSEMSDKVSIFKVDIDEAQDLAATYGVRSVPNLVFFKNGEVVDRVVGAVPKATLATKIEELQ